MNKIQIKINEMLFIQGIECYQITPEVAYKRQVW